MRPFRHRDLLALARPLSGRGPTAPLKGSNPPTVRRPAVARDLSAHHEESSILRRDAVSGAAAASGVRETVPLVAVISPMPEALVSNCPPSGVALYTSRLLETYRGDWDVVAIGQTNSRATSGASRVAVLPTWRPGWAGIWDVMGKLRRLDPKVIHLQHELRLYGGIMPTLALTLSLNWFRLRGARIVITLHGVPRPEDIESQNILPPFPGSGNISKRFLVAYLWLVLASCDAVVVLSRVFRQRLLAMLPSQSTKAHVIPLGVDSRRPGLRTRQKRGVDARPHAIAFGFLTSYKSPELIVDACEQGLLDGFKVTLSVARNPRAGTTQMASRYQTLHARASRLPQINWREYLSDAQLAELLRIADVLILPYTACVASSAVAALAEDAGVPVAYSRPLEELFGSSRACFELTPGALADAVRAVVHDGAVGDTPHAPWPQVAAATFALWQSTLVQR